MKQLTPRHFITCFLTTEEQARYAGVATGTYKNATTGPAADRYTRRVLIQLIKDLEHETASSDGRNKGFYRAAIDQARAFHAELRKPDRYTKS